MQMDSEAGTKTKSTHRIIRSILQDCMIKIPYLHSPDPTHILAVNLMDSHQQLVKSEKDKIVSHQIKLHYRGITPIKTLVIEFASLQDAKHFKHKYSCAQEHIIAQKLLSKDQQHCQKQQYTDMTLQNKFQKASYLEKQLNKYEINYCKVVEKIDCLAGVCFRYGEIAVQYPQSIFIRNIIKNIAKLVVVEGIRAEHQLAQIFQQKTIKGVDLSFLDHKNISSEHNYYRWRVYSYLQGDGDQFYRMQPFQMVANGSMWSPPEQRIADKYAAYSRILLWRQRIYFVQKLLQNLSSVYKYRIEQAMTFCIFNIHSSIQIGVLISQKFLQLCTEKQDKCLIGIMELMSDILFNSPTFIYRQLFLTILPDLLIKYIMENVVNEGVSKKFIQIVTLWEKRYIFEEEFCKGLKYVLENGANILKQIELQREGQLVLTLVKTAHQRNVHQEIVAKNNQQFDLEEQMERYGLSVNWMSQNISQQILAVLKSNQRMAVITSAKQPEASTYDGEDLNEKDILKVKNRGCKVVSCENIPVKNLFNNTNSSTKNSTDRQ